MSESIKPVMANEEIIDIVNELQSIRKIKKKFEVTEKKLVQKLYNHMNEHEELITEDGEVLLTWKYATDTTYFDAKRFKQENEQAYYQYIEKRPGSRRLVLK